MGKNDFFSSIILRFSVTIKPYTYIGIKTYTKHLNTHLHAHTDTFICNFWNIYIYMDSDISPITVYVHPVHYFPRFNNIFLNKFNPDYEGW